MDIFSKNDSNDNNTSLAFENLSTNGAFLTTTNGIETNLMTISWGFVGFAWHRPVFITMIRPNRHTREIIKGADSFTISIPYTDEFKEALKICGTKSGRDFNKIDLVKIDLVNSKNVQSPIVANCNGYFECKIIHIEKLNSELMPLEFVKSFYSTGDYHDLFFGEIVDFYG